MTIHDIRRLESDVARLQNELLKARDEVRSWTNANSSLSRSAAEARAKNQGAGRGLVGALLSPRFKSAIRADAAASNAAISRDVASKRITIAAGKSKAQEKVSQIQAHIAQTKLRIRELKTAQRARERAAKIKARPVVTPGSKTSISLLHKLKEAHALGLLTDTEYQEKRKKIARDI